MKKGWNAVIAAGLICMLLISSGCGRSVYGAVPQLTRARSTESEYHAGKAVKKSGEIKTGSILAEDAGNSKILLLKSTGKRGYRYGTSLWVANCKEYISLRSSDSTSADVLMKIPLYAAVMYLGEAENGFFLVSYNGMCGYALAKYFVDTEPKQGICRYMTVVNCKKSITLRKEPSKKAGEICQLPLGEIVYAVEDAGDGFYMVSYRGNIGYALASYLTKSNIDGVYASSEDSDNYYGQPLWVGLCKEYISLRDDDSTSAKVLAKVPLYAAVRYLGKASNGFVQVLYNDTTGYVLKKYLDNLEPQIAIGTNMTVANCKKSVTFRKLPSTDAGEICQIPLGKTVYVIKDSANDFYMVEYNGRTGFVLAKYLKA